MNDTAIARVRALHCRVEYRPGDYYANYGPPKISLGGYRPEPRPEVVMVCEECQARIDEHLIGESGGFGRWELAEYPCPTICALDGEAS